QLQGRSIPAEVHQAAPGHAARARRLRRPHQAQPVISMSRSELIAAALGLAWTCAACVTMAAAGTPRVVAVSPSGLAVPENLLRISIRFDAAPEGQVLRRLSLASEDGRPLHEPFLDQELWSPDGRVLTVLLHPGRVKTGLIAHEQLGAILAEGEAGNLKL